MTLRNVINGDEIDGGKDFIILFDYYPKAITCTVLRQSPNYGAGKLIKTPTEITDGETPPSTFVVIIFFIIIIQEQRRESSFYTAFFGMFRLYIPGTFRLDISLTGSCQNNGFTKHKSKKHILAVKL